MYNVKEYRCKIQSFSKVPNISTGFLVNLRHPKEFLRLVKEKFKNKLKGTQYINRVSVSKKNTMSSSHFKFEKTTYNQSSLLLHFIQKNRLTRLWK